ncbi:MAG: NusG domain II-containing protein [Lachnospiraceae bacterium]|nr:NusG domain II-containing protein [Lachnospiraceae bacterium]
MFEKKNAIHFIKKYLTVIIILSFFSLALVIYAISQYSSGSYGKIIVLIDGQERGEYSLYESQEIRIETEQGKNILVIKNGQAYVREADCDNQICVHTQPITEYGGQIICLPHKVVIRLKTTEKSEIDAVTN